MNIEKFMEKFSKNNYKVAIALVSCALILPMIGFFLASYHNKVQEIDLLNTQNEALESRNETLDQELSSAEASFVDQIETLEIQSASAKEELNRILEEYGNLKNDFDDFNERALNYINLKSKISNYEDRGVDVANSRDVLAELYDLLLNESYEEFDGEYSEVNVILEDNLATREAEIAAQKAAQEAALAEQQAAAETVPEPITYNQNSRNQYSWYEQKYVETEIGGFWADIVVIDINNPNLRIITDTVDERDNCWDVGCGAKSLGDYVSFNGGFAGIHGNYFCPPDYSFCADNPYSFDLAVYNSRINKWINPYLKYKGLMTFSGTTPTLYYGQEDSILEDINVTAGIANFPALIHNGNLVYSGMDSKQSNVKSYRGGIGYKDNLIYLIIARSATVPDLAYVMKALGVTHALNLDGGGSSALYYDGYKVGPGRLLPNAIVFAE